MYPVYSSVKVTNKTHKRYKQTGIVVSQSEPLEVKFSDGVEAVDLADLQGL